MINLSLDINSLSDRMLDIINRRCCELYMKDNRQEFWGTVWLLAGEINKRNV